MMKFLIKIFFLVIINFTLFAQFYGWQTPENISILNSEKDEFAPFFDKINNKLYFNSTITGVSQLYWTEINGTDFHKPLLHKSKLNNSTENRSYFHFANDGKVYLSKFRRTNKFPVLNLAYSEISKNSFVEPIFIEQLKCDCFCSHPTISSKGSFLIFSSNKNNPANLDLFVSFKDDDGLWSIPLELSEINSSGNEITPFLYNDSLLLFASDGLDGIGGYDIYYSEFYDGKWQRAIPLNEINTEYDESDFTLLDENTAIFSSNRPGGKGGLDLYLSRKAIFQHNVSIIPQITVRINPTELKIKKIMKYININLDETVDFSTDCFNFNPEAQILDGEIIFDYTKNSIKNHIIQIAILYSKLNNQNLNIKISNNINYDSFIKNFKLIAEKLNFPSSNINLEKDSNLPENTFHINIKDKIKLNTLEYQSDLINLFLEVQKDNHFDSLNILIKDNSTKKVVKTLKMLKENINLPLNLNDLKESIYNHSKLNLSIYYVIEQDTIQINDVSLDLNYSLMKYPYTFRQNQKIFFYYIFKFSENKDEFIKLNKNEIEMIKQNLPFAKNIKIYSKQNNLEKISELFNSIIPSSKINILKTTSSDENLNIDIPNNFIMKIELSNH